MIQKDKTLKRHVQCCLNVSNQNNYISKVTTVKYPIKSYLSVISLNLKISAEHTSLTRNRGPV